MTFRGRFILATLCGLILAGMVHIVTILLLPYLAEHDALSQLRSTATADRAELVAVPGNGPTWLPSPDPAMAVAACAYDLSEGPLRVAARTGDLFESISFHGRGSGVFFAVTDRAALRGSLDMVILSQAQLDELLARETDEEPSRDVRIVAPNKEGFLIVRVLAPFASQRERAQAIARSVSCVIDPIPGES